MKRLCLRLLTWFFLASTLSVFLPGQTRVPTEKRALRPRSAASTYGISGTVTYRGAPAPSIVMTGLPGSPATGQDGRYSALVDQDWTGTVTPTLPRARFSPVQKTYMYVRADKTGQDYEISSKDAPVCFYKHLLLLYPNSDISYSQGGANQHYAGSLSSSHQAAIINCFKNLPFLTLDGSGNTVFSSVDVIVINRALTTISPIADWSYWVTPGNIQSDLDNNAPGGKYDSVHVVWNSGPMESQYWGLGGLLLGATSSKTTYSCLIAGAEWWWTNTEGAQVGTGGVFLHEWLHGVSSFYRSLGYAMPDRDADGAVLHGYTDTTPEGWQVYYRDLMQGKVWEPVLSRYAGISPAVWDDNSTARHHGIYGQVATAASAPLPGVRLAFSNGIDAVSTDSGGQYFQVVPNLWSGTVTPSLTSYLFNPQIWIYTGVASNPPPLDFVAILNNHPPVLIPIGDKTIKEGDDLTISVLANDPDGDPLTFSAAGLPAGAAFQNATFLWNPGYAQSGIYTVTFMVSDSYFSVTEKVKITVLNVKKGKGAI